MIDDFLDISLQARYVSFGPRRHPLGMKDYFLIPWWEPFYTDFTFYTEKELRNLHHNFGYSSVKALDMLLQRADGHIFNTTAVICLEEIRKDCNICATFAANPTQFKLIVRFKNSNLIPQSMWTPRFWVVDQPSTWQTKPNNFVPPSFLRNQSNPKIGRFIQQIRSFVYLALQNFFSLIRDRHMRLEKWERPSKHSEHASKEHHSKHDAQLVSW